MDAPPSGAGQLIGAQVGLSFLTSGLTTVQTEEIFLLSCEIQTLRGKTGLGFHQNVPTQKQTSAWGPKQPAMSLRYRRVTWVRPGLHINSLLFRHAIDHQQFMVWLINRSQEAIQALHDRIWKVISRVMESTGRSAADGIGIALHLVGLLPTVSITIGFQYSHT